MSVTRNKMVASLLITSLVCFLSMDFADARRGGGGHRMMRGGPAASGSFHRSFARPTRSLSRATMNRGLNRSAKQSTYRDRVSQRSDNRQDRFDQRQEFRNDRYDDRKEFRKDRYDDRKEFYNDRNEWYEDRWRTGAFLTVAAWNRMNCAYTTIIVENITYYDCDGVRYERVYRGGEVTYIIVN